MLRFFFRRWFQTHLQECAVNRKFGFSRVHRSSNHCCQVKGFTRITLRSSSITTIRYHVKILNSFGRAAWLGTRIILRQVSSESEPIFDFIIQLYHSCDGNWEELSDRLGIPDNDLMSFLDFAAMFLGNIGNYYVSKMLKNFQTLDSV